MRTFEQLSAEEREVVKELENKYQLGAVGAKILQASPKGKPVDASALHAAAVAYRNEWDKNTAAVTYRNLTAKTYLGNAFSLGMIDSNRLTGINIHVTEVLPKQISNEAVSVVGHADTAALFSELLGRQIAFNRVSVTLYKGDTLYVGQYSGPRLPEGATTLPEGATVKWLKVVID
jgi:hypothetical protein